MLFTYNAIGLSDMSIGSHPNFGFVLKYYKYIITQLICIKHINNICMI